MEENRKFYDDWTFEYLMIAFPNKKTMLCLERSEQIKTMKQYNAKQHFTTHESVYGQMSEKQKRRRVDSLLRDRQSQETMMKAPSQNKEQAVLAGLKIFYIINKKRHI